MATLRGDYIGFTYNGIHSSDLGIVRISEGSRFNKNLLPTLQDKTVQIPGGDGTYFFGSYFTNRTFSISFAFDSMTEFQLSFLEELLSDKSPRPLIFDELPYKAYYAKITGSTILKYIPFSEGVTNRVYKGEGSIQFTCYQPYAICTKKFLNEYDEQNIQEWQEASGLMLEKDELDELLISDSKNGVIKVYNPGVKPADWRITIATDTNEFPGLKLKLGQNELIFSKCEKIKDEDEKIVFNSKNRLIEGYKVGEIDSTGLVKTYVKSGSIYNQYILSGDFFDIPVTIIKTPFGISKKTEELQISLINNTNETLVNFFENIEYNYYYL